MEGEFALGLRVEGDEFAGGAGELGDAGNHLIVENALGIVGDDHGIAGGDFLGEQRLRLQGGHPVGRGWGLKIDPAELLALHHYAGLYDRLGRARRFDYGDFFALERLGQLGARFVRAHESADRATSAERGDIECDVGGTAGGPRLAGDIDHGHRGLGRDAGSISPDVAVQHDIADDQNAQACDFFEQRRERFHAQIS